MPSKVKIEDRLPDPPPGCRDVELWNAYWFSIFEAEAQERLNEEMTNNDPRVAQQKR